MKKIVALLLTLVLFCGIVPAALADSTVQCVSCRVNGEILWNVTAPTTLTAIADLPEGMTPDFWMVNGVKAAGFDGLPYLVFSVSGNTTVQCVGKFTSDSAASGVPVIPTATDAPVVTKEDKPLIVTVKGGATLQYLGKDGKPAGDKYDEIDFTADGTVDVGITANPAKGQKIAYWVLNGKKYDFYEYAIKAITVQKLTYPLSVEVVYTDSEPETLLSREEIAALNVPGEKLVVTTKSASACFMDEKNHGAGGWHKEIDFTEDYVNLATNQVEEGGRVTLNVKANCPENRRVRGWKFNGAEFRFDQTMEMFRVYDQYETMEYEPIFSSVYYKVTCKNCTFSGGGYKNAKSGSVPSGTKITVTPNSSCNWSYKVVNYQVQFDKAAKTFTITKDSSFECGWDPIY